MINKNLFLLFLFAISQNVCFAQKKNSNTAPYPYGNPVIKHMYTADASPHVMPDGKVWMVTSVDSENGGGYSTMHNYHTFSSSDMVNWTDHGEVLNIADVRPSNVDIQKEKWALWAPDMIYRHGRYFLYFPVRILYPDSLNQNGKPVVKSYIGVAESSSLDKPFKVIKSKIEGTQGIDPAVFGDDDGSLYLLWGQEKMARLKENMMELDGKVTTLELGTNRFMEAIWMHKRENKYYISYHTKYGNKIDPNNPDDPARDKSEIAYSVSDSPFGPYTYGGVVNYELGVNVENGPKYKDKNYVPWRLTQSNHVGMVEFHGKDYLFYHTSALSSWRQDNFKDMGTWTQRSVCVDLINFDSNGNILPVKQTIEGVAKVAINQPYEIMLQKEAKSIVSPKEPQVFKKINLGSGYYYFRLEANQVSNSALVEVRLDSPTGKLVGTVPVTQDGIKTRAMREAKGLHDVYLVFKNVTPDFKATIKNIRFIAGSPNSN
jgi:arabinoxylan arabinofuranohydrolase